MLKLFIVDDEPDTREGLRYYFDWAKYGIEVIGEANDGKTALEPIMAQKPDIVLTDVKMPNMDGIELATRLRELDDKIKIVFISGYDDVSYLRSALRVEAVDYILKPVRLQELSSVMEKITKIIGEENDRKDVINRLNIKLTESLPVLREKFFMTLIRDGIQKNIDLNSKISFLELELPSSEDYCAVIISVDDKALVFDRMTERERQLTSFSVTNICEELIGSHLRGYAFENRQGEYVCLLRLLRREEEEKLYPLVNDIKENLVKCLKLSITIGIGKVVHGLENVNQSYIKAFDNVSQKMFLGKNKIITMDNLEYENNDNCKFDFSNTQLLENVLKAAEEDKIRAYVDNIFMELSSGKYPNIKYCLNICLHLVLTASRILMELEISIHDHDFDEMTVWDRLFKLETLEDIKSFLTSYFITVGRYISEKRNKKSRNVIEKIKDVIYRRYNEDIGINDIAGEVYLTTTYICMIFKQETGETVNDFLTRHRIEKAKVLLRDNRNKLYDICYKVGFNNPSYFSKIFKKYTGITPNEFREKVI